MYLSHDFCHMNLLMVGFRSEDGILVLDMSTGSAFLQLCMPFHFHVYQYG